MGVSDLPVAVWACCKLPYDRSDHHLQSHHHQFSDGNQEHLQLLLRPVCTQTHTHTHTHTHTRTRTRSHTHSLSEPTPLPNAMYPPPRRRGQGETNPLPLPLPRPLLYPLPTATRTPATQCPPGQTKWRGRGRHWAGGKGRTKEGNRTGQTALADSGAERRRRRRKGKTGKNHCGC